MQEFSIRTLAGALLALALVASGSAFAQGMYYKEIERDGRVYVFNLAADAAGFEKSGEMGRAITRPGAGPKGETIVADSERALQLYFFKHGISEVVPEPAQPTLRIAWRDGKTRIATDQAYLEMSNRVQVRYTQEIPPNNVLLGGAEAPGDTRGSFRIRRSKFKMEGWLYRQNLTYEVQLNWPAAAGSNPGAMLEDASIGWDPKGTGRFRVILGQFKPPMGRQEMTSSGSQQFVDRALVSNEYARGRETGAAVQGVLFGNRLEYRAALFNGNGLTRTTNDNDTFQYNARLMWQPNGSQNLVQRAWVSGPLYSEADFESTTAPIYAIALNVESNDFHRTTTGNDLKSVIVGLDGIFKYKGLFAAGEYDWRQREPEVGAQFESNGWYAQAGKMLDRARTWEAALRFGEREVSDLVANDDVTEMRVGLSYYYRRHTTKFQVDAGQVETQMGLAGGLRKDREVRVQTQIIF